MTSKELDKLIEAVDEDEEMGSHYHKGRMLSEIALQLAKLNEHFERVDGEVFGTSVEGKKK